MQSMGRRARGGITILFALAVGACAQSGHRSSIFDPPSPENPAYLFSYFRGNGDDGVHLAWSADGITWSALNGGKSVITPAITGDGIGWQDWNSKGALMGDPSIIYGPDKLFHMVWTVAWTDHGIGEAHSPDLIHWSSQTRVPVMDHEPNALNAWAPDLFYDDVKREYVIVWATSIPGRFPATDSVAQRTSRGRADHRLYYVTTKDFKHFEPFTDSLHAPRMRHGSAFLAPAWVLKGLQALDTTSQR